MPSDLESTRLGYFNSGLALGAQYGEGLELKLRKQAQASHEADRRIREREVAARISQIDLENQKLSAEIKAKAEGDAQWLNFNTDLYKKQTALEAGELGAGDQQQIEQSLKDLRDQGAVRLSGTSGAAAKYLTGRVAEENFRSDIAKREHDAAELKLQGRRQESLDKLASQRIDNAATHNRNEAARLQLQQMGYSLRQVEQMMKASELGYEIQGQPDVSPQGTAAPTLVPAQRPLTTTALSQVQQRSSEADTALASLASAVTAIQKNPGAIGVRGIVGQTIENVKGQLNPNSTEATPITDTRQKASMAFANIAKSLRVDSGNMSRYELEKLEQAGDVLSWEKGAPGALNQFANIQNAVVAQKLRLLKLQHAKPDDTVLRAISKSEFPALLKDNLISLEDIARAKKAGVLTETEALAIFDSLQQP